MHLRLGRGHQVDQCVYTHPDRYLLVSAAVNGLGNAIRYTKRLQSDEQGIETAVGRLLPETLRLFDSASFREALMTLPINACTRTQTTIRSVHVRALFLHSPLPFYALHISCGGTAHGYVRRFSLG